MSNLIGNLPPPYPNAAQALSKVSQDAELRAQMKKTAEEQQVRTSPSDSGAQSGSASQGDTGSSTGGKSGVDVSA